MTTEPDELKETGRRPYKVAIIAPTCFYYQIPIFRELAVNSRIELMIYFCTEEALHAHDVQKKFKSDRRWGGETELLEGYPYKFLRNYSPSASYINWPLGLVNVGIWNEIKNNRPDVVILMSWMNITWWVAILACQFFKIPFLYMTDANVRDDLTNRGWKNWFKKVLLGKMLFPLTSGFLCSGEANRQLYTRYGVPDEKLFNFAFSWGYKALLGASDSLKPKRQQLRAELGIPEDTFLFLFSGRLSREKRPFDLLEAYWRVTSPNKALLFVGDGQLKSELVTYVADHGLDGVNCAGFQDRVEILKYYAICDVLVLPSSYEPWGMVVNEAMCFGNPVIVSDQVGAGMDLVVHGYNGYVFPSGDVEAMASAFNHLMGLSEEERLEMGSRSRELMEKWTEKHLPGMLIQHLDTIYSRKGTRADKNLS